MKNIIYIVLLLTCVNGFCQTQNFWTKKNDFGGLKRERAVSFTIDSFAYVGTGVDTAEKVLNDFWRYDPINDSWTQVADLPGSVRRNAIAFTIGEIGYVGTGIDSVTASTPGANVLNDFWSYEANTNTWTQKGDFPGSNGVGIYFATAFNIDSKGYICAGKRGPNNYTDELWEYKPSIDQWAQLAPFPGGIRYQLSSFSIGLKAYVGLGTDQDYYRNDVWEFDATTNQWTEKSDFPASERGSSMTFTIGNRGYVCMGTNGGLLDDLWRYNPDHDEWSIKANYGGTARKNAVAFSLLGKGYVGTGKGYSGKKASFHEYIPSDVLSIDQHNDISFQMYPNPVIDLITIQTNQVFNSIQIIDLNGKILLTTSEKQIPVHQLKGGTYFIQLTTDKNLITTQKFIKA